eukprot:GHVQ01043056.1.p1 GENE.GHVQ01043056.1~~GHVQ01043056.1.p1  ORF type:complete len:467 (-),score=47.89 GHVQ01043056.1:640-2040(-)
MYCQVIGDFHLLDKLAHFDRERIPERVVHAKGAGAFGYFEVTNDITRLCKAQLFSHIGKRTELFCRFSTVGGEKGSADTARDPRGFAIKFYTEEGNWDLVGNNTPVFFIRDPLKFSDFIHTQKKHPQTNLPNADMFWDFLSLVPESVHQVTILFSDRGTPDGYRHMNGYSSHSFKLINKQGDGHYVKFHVKTDQGIKNLTGKQAGELASSDPDYATRDLFNAIDKGNFPSWTMYVQTMPVSHAKQYKWNVLDVTKVWPHKDYPLFLVGKMVLNRNPENYFAAVEQAAFSPAHLVPGIEPSEDKMLQGRLFSYSDTHRHRLGANYDMIPVNTPWNAPRGDYNIRDGPMCVTANKGSTPNYEPNSVLGTPIEKNEFKTAPYPVSGNVARAKPSHANDDFAQAGNLYRYVMTDYDREHLISNIVGHLKNATREIQQRQVKVFGRADPEYGQRVAAGLGLPTETAITSRM